MHNWHKCAIDISLYSDATNFVFVLLSLTLSLSDDKPWYFTGQLSTHFISLNLLIDSFFLFVRNKPSTSASKIIWHTLRSSWRYDARKLQSVNEQLNTKSFPSIFVALIWILYLLLYMILITKWVIYSFQTICTTIYQDIEL